MSNPGYQGDSVRYTTPNRLHHLEGQVDEVTGIMKNNIRLELERAGKLDDLESKTDILSESSRQFAVTSNRLKKKYWWRNCRMWVILTVIALIVIIIIIIGVVVGKSRSGK